MTSFSSSKDGFPSVSRVQICGENAHECGYCKSKDNTSLSYGVIANVITVEDYERLMLVGWRRSGSYFYKPLMHKTCCPQFPIRLNVQEFKSSKSQKKVMKNVRKFLDGANRAYDNLAVSEAATSSSSTTNNQEGHAFEVALEPASFTKEKYELYRRYQIAVHKDAPDEVTEKGFKRFLVNSPLIDTSNKKHKCLGSLTSRWGHSAGCATGSSTSDGGRVESASTGGSSSEGEEEYAYGTYHQCYRLDGRLVAVGVMDILPSGLSSVYVFYDNDLRDDLYPGKFSALQEIEFCKATLGLPYYYMGFYIHSCVKMRYKAEYSPSELLCPTTLQWYSFDGVCRSLLDHYNFSPFHPLLAKQREALSSSSATVATAAPPVKESSSSSAAEESADIPPTSSSTRSSSSSSSSSSTLLNGSSAKDAVNLDIFAPQFRGFLLMQYGSSTGRSTSSSSSNDKGDATNCVEAAEFGSAVFGSTVYQKAVEEFAMNELPLDIGVNRCIYLNQLRPQDTVKLKSFLLEWLHAVGPENARHVTLSLC